MLIDWFTVAAQIVNFAILVALMQRFLYGPLVRAIDAREQRIAAELAEADLKKKDAERQDERAQEQIAQMESRCAQLIAAARDDADRQKNEMLQSARDSVRNLESKWRDDLRLQKTAFFHEVRLAAAAEILAITRRVLADLASSDIQHSAVEAFLEKLRSFDVATLGKLAAGGMVVVSATEIAAELRREIEETIEKRVGIPARLSFEQEPEMSWGIELRGNGERIGWTPEGYLDSLEERLRSALEQRAELASAVTVE